MSDDVPARPVSPEPDSPSREREGLLEGDRERHRERDRELWEGSSYFSEDSEDGDDDDDDDDLSDDHVDGRDGSDVGSAGSAGAHDNGGEEAGTMGTEANGATNTITDATTDEETEPARRRRRRRRRRADKSQYRGLLKKLAFLTDLLTCLDSLVFMELGAFYYLECSLWRLCLRAILHYLFLTPKSASFPFLIPAAQTHIVSIVVPNVLCFLIHLFGSLPRASRENHRGYLHGGVLADFVGQKPPTSRVPLLLLDCVVLLLQWLMLAVHSDREKVRGSMRTFVPLGGGEAGSEGFGRQPAFRIAIANDLVARAGAASAHNVAEATMQAQDAAERGEASGSAERDGSGSEDSNGETGTSDAEAADGAEPTSPDGTEGGARGPAEEEVADALLFDVLSSGLGMVGHFDLIHTLRTATMDFESAAAHSLRTLSYTANLTALAARRGSLPIEPQPPASNP